MILSELITLVRAQLEGETAALYSDANIISWINDAERDIAAKTRCLRGYIDSSITAGSRGIELLTGTTADDAFYKVHYVECISSILVPCDAIPNYITWHDSTDIVWHDDTDMIWYDTVDVVTRKLKANEALMQITPSQLYHLPHRAETYPQYWYQWGNTLCIEPIADKTYNLRIYVSGSPTEEMAIDGDSPQIPILFQQAIVPYATMMGRLKSRQYADANVFYAEYTEYLKTTMANYIDKYPITLPEMQLPDKMVRK
jgi:hypothetical protein